MWHYLNEEVVRILRRTDYELQGLSASQHSKVRKMALSATQQYQSFDETSSKFILPSDQSEDLECCIKAVDFDHCEVPLDSNQPHLPGGRP